MDFLALAINYLILMSLGISLETLFSGFYIADRYFKFSDTGHYAHSEFELDIFDFIIVGAGSAGCVLANRLSARNYKVLLLEAGGNPFPLTLVPGLATKLLRNPNIDYGFMSAPQKHSFQSHKNNSYMIHRGKGLGGSSLLNFNMYMRGSPLDFEEWANMTGDDSWRYENVLKFFKKIENYQGYFPLDDVHGTDGPLHVESPVFFPMRDEWLQAGMEMGLRVKDPNGFQTESVFPVDTSTLRGTRVSTYRAYLHPVLGRRNLKVITYAQAQKIIFNDKNKVVAVSYSHDGKIHQVYIRDGTGPYSSTGSEVGALFSSSLASRTDWPAIYLTYWPYGVSKVFAIDQENLYLTRSGLLTKYMAADIGSDGFIVFIVLAKPKSFGELTLASANPNEHPIIDPNFLSHPDDIKVLLEGIQKSLKMTTQTNAFKKIGARLTNSSFPGCEKFVHLSAEYWDCYARNFCNSMYHPSGTCRMGRSSGDPGAVVDSQLRVLGTTGLRVIDASIMPQKLRTFFDTSLEHTTRRNFSVRPNISCYC
ncbi:unnamed protein product [Allacma fusca]|uniref:Glucose-methanol-choline oxidoreductase N-terminal domain-containing protein n=2 Tax=Allacma fusca TaxID=39272 RepID=A0A8J2JXD4_9HEXA|nr:unnamed protein product [Allacma fusca]